MHTDEERGFHVELFLIIYISFLYMLRSGLLNMWRQGNGGFASRNTVLILHELRSFSTNRLSSLLLAKDQGDQTFPAGLTWDKRVLGTCCISGAKSKLGALRDDMFLQSQGVLYIREAGEGSGVFLGTAFSTVDWLHS